jgi:hypothetical protein
MTIIKKTTANAGKDAGRKGTLYAVDGNEWSHYGNQYGSSSKNLK